jgi:RecB family exonuclease
MLRERLLAHPEWFGSGLHVRNELTIFGSDGLRNRPDRVVEHPDGSIDIIDYKFGAQRQSYLRQVRRYMDLYLAMGYGPVRGYVWYVPEDKVVEV